MSLHTLEIDTSSEYSELRRGVRGLCAPFPGEYWQRLDGERRYPVAFVEAMPAAGYLAALILEGEVGVSMELRERP